MKYLLVFVATLLFVSFFVSSVTARVQQREMRDVEVEQSQKEAGSARDSTGRARIKMEVGTEDGLRPESIMVNFHGGYELVRPAKHKFSFDVPAGSLDLYVMAEGYVPAYLAKGKQFNSGDVVEYQVMLSRGTLTEFRVVDQDGKPISGAGVRTYASKVKPTSQSASSWGRVSRSDAEGFVDVYLPKDTERIHLNVFKGGYSTFKIESPKVGESVEVILAKLPVTRGVVRDHEGNPVVGALVYHLGRSNMKQLAGSSNYRKAESACAETGEGGAFSTDKLASGSWHSLLVETETQRGVYSGIRAEEELDLKLPPPRAMTFKFEGDLDRLDSDNLMTYQNAYGDDGGHAFVELPHSWDNDKKVLTVNGILKGNFQITTGGLGQLFSIDEFKEGQTEVVVKIETPEIIRRTVKVRFESDGEAATPRGLLGFRERTLEVDGSIRVGLLQYRKVRDGLVTIKTEATSISLESTGLVGFAINQSEVLSELKDVADGDTKEVKLNVSLAGSVRGVVLDSDGNPVSIQVTCLYRCSKGDDGFPYFQEREVDTGSDGKFVLTPIHFGSAVKIRTGGLGQKQTERTVKIDEDQPLLDIEIVMPAAKSANSGSKQ